MSNDERQVRTQKYFRKKWSSEETLKIVPMSFLEESFVLFMLLFGVPGSAYSIPVLLILVGYFVVGNTLQTLLLGLLMLAPLAYLPAPFIEKSLTSWASHQFLRYFSMKFIFFEKPKANKPYILVS
jgi:hypothetical protein